MKFKALLLGFLFVLPAYSENYQENVSVELVQVYISAKDEDRRFVTDLRPEDLVLQEDGQTMKIIDFTNLSNAPGSATEVPPLTIALSIDISGSMSSMSNDRDRKIDLAKLAALSLVSELKPQDRMTVYGFHYLPKIIVPMTSDTSLIKEKLASQFAEDQETALFDSLYIMLEQLQKEPGRKVLVLGSDGEDTSSHIEFEKLLEALQASDITLFAFGMESMDPTHKDNRYTLNKLAEATGGYAYFPKSENDLNDIILQIRKVIRSQYLLYYTPMNSTKDGSWRNIDITCRRPGVELRYRNGYYSGKEKSVVTATR